jgi:hypothetical protein
MNSTDLIKTSILDNSTPIPIVYDEYSQFKGETVRSNFWKFLEEYTSTCHEKHFLLITSTHIITSKRIIQVKIFSLWIPFARFSYFKFDLNVLVIRCVQNHEINTNSKIRNELELLNPTSIKNQFLLNDLASKHHLSLSFSIRLTIKKILYQDPIHNFSRLYEIDFGREHLNLKSFLSLKRSDIDVELKILHIQLTKLGSLKIIY